PGPAPALAGAVRLRDRRGRELGWADHNPHSQIRLRLLSRDPGAKLDRPFFRQRLQAALAYRRIVVRDSSAFRLIASEGDGLPGLIVDVYGDRPGGALAFQTLTAAMAARQDALLEDLRSLLQPAVIVERNEAKIRTREGLSLNHELLQGASALVETEINGLKLGFDLLAGQKTGGFLDQRENWATAAAWAARFGAKTALDVFTYQGGFALHLGKAVPGLQLEGVDGSRVALEGAEANFRRNQLPEQNWIEANAFDLLRDYDRRGRKFDVVVLDPPAFAKSRSTLESALAGYKEINLRALKLLNRGGLLVTCSCSHHMDEETFLSMLRAAAADAQRELTMLQRRGQALDHPVLLAVPETRYLKCVLARVA
ncbi:MAG: class I SAM-dependent rRNA methyltransferase, partial [Terriglobales bacterium]